MNVGRIGEIALWVALMALGRPVLVPLALAFYLAFVLTPASDLLERLGAPRAVSVATVVGAALAAVGVIGSVLLAQTLDLSRQLKTYSAEMKQKLSGIRTGTLGDLSDALSDLGKILDPEAAAPAPTASVRVLAHGTSAFQRLEQSVGPLLEPVAVTTIVFVMAIFMLAYREDLRGRLIQLVGPNNVTTTTRTMAEAVRRVSHFLVTQVWINVAFGAVVAVGLYAIGIPYALLWGVLACVLRFAPLLGVVIAAGMPALVAFAIFPGWREVGLTVGLFLVADMLFANALEPLVVGKRTGVSALALLVSALFWTWLWGPVGLVLATPITVCAAVVGRHVPELSFLAIALGDETGLNAEVNFYQRTLAKATKDAHRLAKRKIAETSLGEAFDELLVPALGLMIHDRNVGAIDQASADQVVNDIAEIARRLRPPAPSGARPASSPRIFGLPAESSADVLLVDLVQITVEQEAGSMRAVRELGRRTAESAAIAERPDAVCITALPPGGNVNARYLCRRIRAALPDCRIVVLAPQLEAGHTGEAAARLRAAGANHVAYGVREATRLLLDPSA